MMKFRLKKRKFKPGAFHVKLREMIDLCTEFGFQNPEKQQDQEDRIEEIFGILEGMVKPKYLKPLPNFLLPTYPRSKPIKEKK